MKRIALHYFFISQFSLSAISNLPSLTPLLSCVQAHNNYLEVKERVLGFKFPGSISTKALQSRDTKGKGLNFHLFALGEQSREIRERFQEILT